MLALPLHAGCHLIAGYDEVSSDATGARDAGANDANALDGATDSPAREAAMVDGGALDAPSEALITTDASVDSRAIDETPQLLSGLPATTGARAGAAVAVSGQWIAVGAPGSEGAAPMLGRVTLWHCEFGSCTLKQTLEKPEGSRFGAALALVGDRLAVGAPGLDTVFLYALSNDTWVSIPSMNSGTGNLSFGATLAMDAERLVVGYTSLGQDKHVALYTLGPSLQIETTLAETSPSFGESLAIAGEMLLVGDPSLDGDTGGVEVYELRGGGWSAVNTLRPADTARPPEPGSECGSSIALSAALMVVACRNHDMVFPFQLSNSKWNALAAFGVQATPALSLTDNSVALSGRVLLVGTPHRAPTSSIKESGGVTAFQKTLNTAGWNGPSYRNMTPPVADVHFGWAVAVDGNLAVAGAPDLALPGSIESGAAFVFTPW